MYSSIKNIKLFSHSNSFFPSGRRFGGKLDRYKTFFYLHIYEDDERKYLLGVWTLVKLFIYSETPFKVSFDVSVTSFWCGVYRLVCL